MTDDTRYPTFDIAVARALFVYFFRPMSRPRHEVRQPDQSVYGLSVPLADFPDEMVKVLPWKERIQVTTYSPPRIDWTGAPAQIGPFMELVSRNIPIDPLLQGLPMTITARPYSVSRPHRDFIAVGLVKARIDTSDFLQNYKLLESLDFNLDTYVEFTRNDR